MCLEDRPVLAPNAGGIDVGAREMFVAVPLGRDEHPVRVFTPFTEDLERLVPLQGPERDFCSRRALLLGGFQADGQLLRFAPKRPHLK